MGLEGDADDPDLADADLARDEQISMEEKTAKARKLLAEPSFEKSLPKVRLGWKLQLGGLDAWVGAVGPIAWPSPGHRLAIAGLAIA